MSCKQIERQRYDDSAVKAIKNLQSGSIPSAGHGIVPLVLRAPYVYYEALLQQVLSRDSVVLEIGSGTGNFTETLLRSGAKVVASDISAWSLDLLKMRYSERNNLTTLQSDMEDLPFADSMFDAVVCAGSLSYGDNQ